MNRILITILIIGGTNWLIAQSPREMRAKGLEFYQHQCYDQVLEVLIPYNESKPGDKEVLEVIANCYYEINNLKEAERIIAVFLSDTKATTSTQFLLKAKILHANLDFLNAIKYYKLAVNSISKPENQRQAIMNEILRCSFGLKYSKLEPIASVENLGNKINSKYDEFAPVISPNVENKLYFAGAWPTSSGGKRNDQGINDELFGHYCSDIYSAVRDENTWNQTEGPSYTLNGPRNEYVVGFTNKGKVLHFFKGFTYFSGDVLVDTFQRNNDQLINPQYFISSVEPTKGDRDINFVNDTIVLFSSNRKGGFGGFDLYITINSTKGWSEPVNLGETINSAFDEISPFLSRDGKQLYFSSNRTESMGGLDVFTAMYEPTRFVWSTPINLGFPINSALDESFFKLSADGGSGYFSSNRKDGFGLRDIYSVYFFNAIESQQTAVVFPPMFLSQYVSYTFVPSKNIINETPKETLSIPINPLSFKLSPLYYVDDYNIMTTDNVNILDKAAIFLIEHPSVKCILTSHSISNENPKVDTYLSLKLAEQATDYLVLQGVKKQQLLARGAGSNFPLIKNEIKTRDKQSPSRLNKRIDINFTNCTELNIEFELQIPEMAKTIMDNRGKLLSDGINGLSYQVQLAVNKQIYTGILLDNQPLFTIEKRELTDLNYYMVGLATLYEEIAPLLQELKSKGVVDAFVVPYINGWPINAATAKQISDRYPDLKTFLMSGK